VLFETESVVDVAHLSRSTEPARGRTDERARLAREVGGDRVLPRGDRGGSEMAGRRRLRDLHGSPLTGLITVTIVSTSGEVTHNFCFPAMRWTVVPDGAVSSPTGG